MTNLRRQILMNALKLSDLSIMMFSFITAAIFVSYQIDTFTLEQIFQMRIKIVNFIVFLGLLYLWYKFFVMLGLYYSWRLGTIRKEIKVILKATSLCTFVTWLMPYIFQIAMVNIVFLVIFWLGSTCAIILTRSVMRYTLYWSRRRGRNLRHLLIVGTNNRVIRFIKKVESRPDLGYTVTGFVDNEWKGTRKLKNYQWTLVSDLKGFNDFIRKNVVDEVLISLPIKSFYKETYQIIKKCENQGILVRHLFSNLFDTNLSNLNGDLFDDESFVSHYGGKMKTWKVLIKGILDRVVSLNLLILLTPLFLAVTVLVIFTSPGPAFFIQERIGMNKRRFKLYKFRTMIDGAEKKQENLEKLNEASGPVFKIKNDPRITKVGRILRRSSLDELPQLLNVLKGDMSLVGPRPLPVRDYDGFSEDWHRRRFCFRPGLTCLWQVNGRSSISFENWMKLDLQYIDEWSLLLDLKIMIKTIPAVLKGAGAI